MERLKKYASDKIFVLIFGLVLISNLNNYRTLLADCPFLARFILRLKYDIGAEYLLNNWFLCFLLQ